MTDESTSYSDAISRRRFVELTGVAGAAALAGCDGDGGTDTPTNDGSGGTDTDSMDGATETDTDTEPSFGTHQSYTNQVPTGIQWNRANGTAAAQISHYAIFDELAKFNYRSSEFQGQIVDSWSFASDNSSLTLTVRSDAVWGNGDDVTGEDLARQIRLGILAGDSFANYITNVSSSGQDCTVDFGSNQVNPDIVLFDLFEQAVLYAHEDNYQQFLDNADDIYATDTPGTAVGTPDSPSANYLSFEDQQPIASGPWTIDSKGPIALELALNDGHPDAGNINFDFDFELIDGNVATQRALKELSIDSVFSLFTPPNVVSEFPGEVNEVQFPGRFGFGLVPDHTNTHLGQRGVRQALAYAIDRPAAQEFGGPRTKEPCPKPMGVPSGDQERVLGDAFADFNAYGSNNGAADGQAGADALPSSYSGGNGSTVEDDSGSAVSFEIECPAGWSDWVNVATAVESQLNDFGFDATLVTSSFSNINGTLYGNGNFDLIAGSWLPGGGRASFPYFSLRYQLIEASWGWNFGYGPADSGQGGTNADVTVPSRTGSGTMTVNPTSRLEELSTTGDESTVNNIVLEQAWVTNQDLPILPVTEKLEQSWLTSHDWDIPDVENSNAPAVKWPQPWLPKRGEMTYTG